MARKKPLKRVKRNGVGVQSGPHPPSSSCDTNADPSPIGSQTSNSASDCDPSSQLSTPIAATKTSTTRKRKASGIKAIPYWEGLGLDHLSSGTSRGVDTSSTVGTKNEHAKRSCIPASFASSSEDRFSAAAPATVTKMGSAAAADVMPFSSHAGRKTARQLLEEQVLHDIECEEALRQQFPWYPFHLDEEEKLTQHVDGSRSGGMGFAASCLNKGSKSNHDGRGASSSASALDPAAASPSGPQRMKNSSCRTSAAQDGSWSAGIPRPTKKRNKSNKIKPGAVVFSDVSDNAADTPVKTVAKSYRPQFTTPGTRSTAASSMADPLTNSGKRRPGVRGPAKEKNMCMSLADTRRITYGILGKSRFAFAINAHKKKHKDRDGLAYGISFPENTARFIRQITEAWMVNQFSQGKLMKLKLKEGAALADTIKEKGDTATSFILSHQDETEDAEDVPPPDEQKDETEDAEDVLPPDEQKEVEKHAEADDEHFSTEVEGKSRDYCMWDKIIIDNRLGDALPLFPGGDDADKAVVDGLGE